MRKLLFALVAIVCMVITSCNNSQNNELLSGIPTDAQLVAVVNVKTIVESAGGSVDNNKIKLPNEITDLFSSKDMEAFNEFNSIIKNASIDVNAVAIFILNDWNRPVFSAVLTDSKKFVEYIEKDGFREKDDEDGTLIYAKRTYESSYDSDYDDYMYVAVNGKHVYMMPDVSPSNGSQTVKTLNNIVADAKDKDFNSNPVASYICNSNAAGVAVNIPRELRKELRSAGLSGSIVDFYTGYVCFDCNINDDKATLDITFLDENGKPKDASSLGDLCNLNAKINSKALSYLTPEESAVMAVALKDVNWDSYFDLIASSTSMSRSERASLSVAKGYLQNIDGTVAMGFGFTNGIESIVNLAHNNDPFAQFVLTIVVETADSKAKSLMNDLKGLIETTGLPLEDTRTGFSINIPYENISFYGEYDDNFLILSNKPIKKSGSKNSTVKAVNFTDYMAAFGIYLDRDNKLLSDLNLNYDATLSAISSAKEMKSNIALQIKGGDKKGLIAKIIKICLDVASQENKFEFKSSPSYYFDDSSSSFYYDDDTDDYWYDDEVEEAVAE